MSDSALQITLSSGRTLSVTWCRCGSCGNEWYVPAISVEFKPLYCCYCGIRFVREEIRDVDFGG